MQNKYKFETLSMLHNGDRPAYLVWQEAEEATQSELDCVWACSSVHQLNNGLYFQICKNTQC